MEALKLSPDDEELIASKPNGLFDFKKDAPTYIPEIHETSGSCSWAIQSGRAEPYLKSGALVKLGNKYKFNPRKYMRTFLSLGQ